MKNLFTSVFCKKNKQLKSASIQQYGWVSIQEDIEWHFMSNSSKYYLCRDTEDINLFNILYSGNAGSRVCFTGLIRNESEFKLLMEMLSIKK